MKRNKAEKPVYMEPTKKLVPIKIGRKLGKRNLNKFKSSRKATFKLPYFFRCKTFYLQLFLNRWQNSSLK